MERTLVSRLFPATARLAPPTMRRTYMNLSFSGKRFHKYFFFQASPNSAGSGRVGNGRHLRMAKVSMKNNDESEKLFELSNEIESAYHNNGIAVDQADIMVIAFTKAPFVYDKHRIN